MSKRRPELQYILDSAKNFKRGEDIAAAIGLTYVGYAYKIKNPNQLQGKDIFRLHERCGVPYDKILKLIVDYNKGEGIFEKS